MKEEALKLHDHDGSCHPVYEKEYENNGQAVEEDEEGDGDSSFDSSYDSY